MNAEYVYDNVVRMLKHYSMMAGEESAYSQVLTKPYEWEHNTLFPFYAEAASLIIACREEMGRRDVGNKQFSALKRFCKECQASANPALSGGIFRNGEYFCLCDSFKYVRLLQDVPGLPHLDDTRIKCVDLTRLVPDDYKLMEITPVEYSVIREAAAQAKALMKTEGKDTVPYSFGVSALCCVNVFSLQTFIEILPDAKWYMVQGSKFEPLYMRTAEGEDGLILPVGGTAAKIINR